MPEVTAKTPVGAAIQAAKGAMQNNNADIRTDTGVVNEPQKEATSTPEDSQRYAALARREKALRSAQRDFLAQKAEWDKRSQVPQVNQDEIRAKLQQELQDRIANDPMAVLSEFGVELKALKDSQKSAQEILEQQRQARAEDEKKFLRGQVRVMMESSTEFEAIKALNAEEAVAELVMTSLQEGDELSIKEAAQQVEDYLVEEALKAAAIPKIKSKLTPAQAAQLQAEETEQPQKPRIPTITNDMTASSQRTFSAKERRQRAIWAGMGLDPNTGKPLQT